MKKTDMKDTGIMVNTKMRKDKSLLSMHPESDIMKIIYPIACCNLSGRNLNVGRTKSIFKA